MAFTRFMKPETRQSLIDTREAMNIWNILNACYTIIERLEADSKMTHDIDLKIVLSRIIKNLHNDTTKLKQQLETYQIKGPDRGRLPSEWTGNPEVSRDELIAKLALIFLEEHLGNLLLANRTSITNDNIRQIFYRMIIKLTNQIDLLLKYLKVKGWIESPPIYPNTPPNNEENLDCGTAGDLWNHLCRRYDHMRKTEFYDALAHDLDFKIVIDLGLNTLKEQINILEKECQKFGIPLPKRPSEVIIAPVSTDLINDDQMYRDIFLGLQGAALLHISAYKQCKLNDRIRNLFKQMIIQELDFFEIFLKYGKTKGWLHPAPSYKV